MTYFGFLLWFLVLPLLFLILLALWDKYRGITLPPSLQGWSPWTVLALLVVIAVVYTTPWDNYLVATRVWWYDPALVTGITLGWVPLEEYTFFVLQTLFTGLWTLYLGRRLAADVKPASLYHRLRWISVGIGGILWLISIFLLWSGWSPGGYLGLELVWALPPILLQLGFGADILWQRRRLVFWSIVPTTIYLSSADTIAIDSGTWTISPDFSLGILLGGILPIEELLFFLLTNILVVFGMVLALDQTAMKRVRHSN